MSDRRDRNSFDGYLMEPRPADRRSDTPARRSDGPLLPIVSNDQATVPPELKPCPLCPDGGKPYFTKSVNGSKMLYVGCSQCGLELKAMLVMVTPTEEQPSKDIVKIWNTRPDLATPVATAEATCEWKKDDDGVWWTACGEAFVFDVGGPTENKIKWCGYCGQPLKEVGE